MTTESPLQSVPALARHFYLGRQPILNRSQRLVAYELLFRKADGAPEGVADDAAATATVMAHAAELGMERVVGEQLAFLNVDQVGLMSDFIRFLPADNLILELRETVPATPEVLARVRELKEAGFRFALDNVVAGSDDVLQLLPLMDVVKIDIRHIAPESLAPLVQAMRGARRKLLAAKVETVAGFQQCLDLGFDYFQGYYFARPVILSGKKIMPSQLAILRLLNLLNADADQRELESSVKHDPLITLNLLRLVNTPAVGARFRITSVGHALVVLGRRQLQRWLQILLYVRTGQKPEFDSPLLQLATTRGKTLELMMEHLHPDDHAGADIGFMVGVMSLMDTLFSVDMEAILQSVNVPDDVRGALLARQGSYGRMLALVEHGERLEQDGEAAALGSLLGELALSPADLYAIQAAAFEWVSGYAGGMQ